MKKQLVVTMVGLLFCLSLTQVVALWLRDPEVIRRVGATLSALGAALVVYQAFVENKMESNKSKESALRSTLPPFSLEVAEKILLQRERKRKNERIGIVISIALIICFGEIMHG